jgi:hypothetical protein
VPDLDRAAAAWLPGGSYGRRPNPKVAGTVAPAVCGRPE